MNTPKLFLIALGSLSMIVLGGCNTVSQRDYDAAIDENTQLRERIAGLQENVRQANDGNGAFQQQNADLRSSNQQLSSDLDAANAALAARPNTGFEGINGVEIGLRSGGAIVVRVPGDVLFNSGSDQLRKSAKATLDQISQVIRSDYSNNVVRVEGYTDTDKLVKTKKKWGTNERLSAHRALAVETYLVGKGIDNDRIYSAAFGPSDAKATKKDSRRVEIVILGG
ncbi:MAG: OmpA family protein [Phycisphaerales bacterium]|nr:OmpA family protein [Phycisphaerales bacterium]